MSCRPGENPAEASRGSSDRGGPTTSACPGPSPSSGLSSGRALSPTSNFPPRPHPPRNVFSGLCDEVCQNLSLGSISDDPGGDASDSGDSTEPGAGTAGATETTPAQNTDGDGDSDEQSLHLLQAATRRSKSAARAHKKQSKKIKLECRKITRGPSDLGRPPMGKEKEEQLYQEFVEDCRKTRRGEVPLAERKRWTRARFGTRFWEMLREDPGFWAGGVVRGAGEASKHFLHPVGRGMRERARWARCFTRRHNIRVFRGATIKSKTKRPPAELAECVREGWRNFDEAKADVAKAAAGEDDPLIVILNSDETNVLSHYQPDETALPEGMEPLGDDAARAPDARESLSLLATMTSTRDVFVPPVVLCHGSYPSRPKKMEIANVMASRYRGWSRIYAAGSETGKSRMTLKVWDSVAEWLASYKAHLDGESGRRSFWIWTYDKDPGHGLSQVRRSALRQQGIYPAPLGPDTTHLAQPLDCLGPFREMKRNWRKAVAEKDPSAPHFTLGRNWDVVTWQLLRFGTAEVFAKAGYSVGPRDASLFWGKLRDLMESEAAAPGAEAGDAMPLGGTS